MGRNSSGSASSGEYPTAGIDEVSASSYEASPQLGNPVGGVAPLPFVSWTGRRGRANSPVTGAPSEGAGDPCRPEAEWSSDSDVDPYGGVCGAAVPGARPKDGSPYPARRRSHRRESARRESLRRTTRPYERPRGARGSPKGARGAGGSPKGARRSGSLPEGRLAVRGAPRSGQAPRKGTRGAAGWPKDDPRTRDPARRRSDRRRSARRDSAGGAG